MTNKTSLHSLVDFAKECSDMPFFVLPEKAKQDYIKKLTEISNEITKKLAKTKGDIYKNFNNLKKAISKKEINETEISSILLRIAEMYNEEDKPEIQKLAKQLFDYSQKIFRRANNWQAFFEKRKMMIQEKSKEEIDTLDHNTLKNEGLLYCMEYYLAVYWALKNSDEKKKQYYLESKKIDLGIGESAGLLDDFDHDEALQKFILLIINDDWRNNLINSYYNLKLELINYTKNQNNLDNVMKKYKEFLISFIAILEQAGIQKITSSFYKPLGDEPTLAKVKKSL